MARVLVIESDAAVRDVLTSCLELDAHTVRATPDLAGGLRLLAAERFDLVLADPFQDGAMGPAALPLQAVTAAAPSVPLVLTTTLPQTMDQGPAAYGVAGILVKPFDIDDLLRCVADVLASQQQRVKDLRWIADQTHTRIGAAHAQVGRGASMLRQALSEYRSGRPDGADQR